MGQQIVTAAQINLVPSALVSPPGGLGVGVDSDGIAKLIDPNGNKRAITAANDWAAARQGPLSKLVSGLVYVYVKPVIAGNVVLAATPTALTGDPNFIGQGVSPGANQHATITGTIYTDLTTQPHAWAVRGRFNTPSANFQSMGPIVAGAGKDNYANLVAFSTYDATKLCLQLFKTGDLNGTVVPLNHVIDGNNHHYGMAFDGVTYFGLVDDVVVGSTSDLSHLTSGNRIFTVSNGTANDVKLFDLVYGYRQP